MASKKRPNNKTSNYLISMGEGDLSRDGSNYLGKLRSNFVGTEFQVSFSFLLPRITLSNMILSGLLCPCTAPTPFNSIQPPSALRYLITGPTLRNQSRTSRLLPEVSRALLLSSPVAACPDAQTGCLAWIAQSAYLDFPLVTIPCLILLYSLPAASSISHLHSGGVRKDLGAVMYAANVLGSRGPRKMQVSVNTSRSS